MEEEDPKVQLSKWGIASVLILQRWQLFPGSTKTIFRYKFLCRFWLGVVFHHCLSVCVQDDSKKEPVDFDEIWGR